MKTQLYPTAPSGHPSDSQWKIIQPLLPRVKSGGRPRELDLRMVVNAILYLVVGGIQWRMLPKEYPKWQSVYYYFRCWRNDGTGQRIHETLRAEVHRKARRHKHPTAGCLDSQSVKSTAVPGERGYDKAKNVTGRKRHLLVDTLGLLLVVVVTAACLPAREGAKLVFQRRTGACKKLRRIWVDGGIGGRVCSIG